MALDPGNSTGWVCRANTASFAETLYGGTVEADHEKVWRLLNTYNPDIVVYETFQMYPNKAQKLIWNSFYPCEVIGVIKLWVMLHGAQLVGLQPSVKKFALGESDDWHEVVRLGGPATEHMRDAYRLLRYYERNKG